MGSVYSHAGKDVATATWETGAAPLNALLENSAILVAVAALGTLTACMVYFWQFAIFAPLKMVAGLSWDVAVGAAVVNTLIGFTVKKKLILIVIL